MTVPGKPRRSRRVILRRQPLTVTRWWALLVICSSLVAVTLSGILYTGYVDGQRERAERQARAQLEQQEREADRRWCRLLQLFNSIYAASPPQTGNGAAIAREMLILTRELGCPPP